MKSTARIPQPATPFSANVTPFRFGDALHRDLSRALNVKNNNRNARVKTHRTSAGVVWDGLPFYWTTKGFYRSGANGRRRPLQQLVWEKAHRRKVPPAHVVSFADGNLNNLAPRNLVLKSKAAIGIGNQRHDKMDWFGIAAKKQDRKGEREGRLLLQKFNRGEHALVTQIKISSPGRPRKVRLETDGLAASEGAAASLVMCKETNDET